MNVDGNLKRCACGCMKLFPANNEFFPPSKQQLDGFYPYSRECKARRGRERREKRAKEAGRRFTGRETKYLEKTVVD